MVLAPLLSDAGLMRNRRYFATTLALLTALSAVGIVHLAKSVKTKPVAAIGAAIVTFFTIWGLHRHYSESPHKPWREMAKTIQNQIHVDEYQILFSSREFKKTRVEYFVENSFTLEETIPVS